MKPGNTLAARIEALCLLALAGFVVYLVLGGHYWLYLNPKFKWLSLAAATVLAGLGIFGLARPPVHGRTSWLRTGLFLLVLVLCLVSELGIGRTLGRLQTNASQTGGQTDDQTGQAAEEAVLPARVTVNGREYIRMNLGELFDIASQPTPEFTNKAFAVRGFVYRTKELDAAGQFLLFRTALYCCFADSTAVAFRVRPPKGKALPASGDWLVVMGTLAQTENITDAPDPTIPGAPFASVQPEFALQADTLEKQQPPGMGLMYEWRHEEPYAY